MRLVGVARLATGMAACAAIACVSLGLAPPAHAQDKLLEEAVEFAGTILYIEVGVPGLVIGAVRNGETAVFGFGKANERSDAAPNGDTLIHIGSLSKVLTGATLASMVADGSVSFTEPLQGRLRGVTVPTRDGKAIRLIDLATHAAGLPRELAPEDSSIADVRVDTPEQLTGALSKQELLFAPGTGVLYSNFAFDLLALALADAGGKPYAELLKERVLDPAGMADTLTELRPDQTGRTFDGHGPDGAPIPFSSPSPMNLGSGSVVTSANDMMKWLKWHMDRFSAENAEMRLLDHAPYLPRDGLDPVLGLDDGGPMSAMGLGWVIMEPDGNRPLVLQKSGGFEGTFSYIAFAPTHGVGVFVSMNQFNFAGFGDMVRIANELLAQLAPR